MCLYPFPRRRLILESWETGDSYSLLSLHPVSLSSPPICWRLASCQSLRDTVNSIAASRINSCLWKSGQKSWVTAVDRCCCQLHITLTSPGSRAINMRSRRDVSTLSRKDKPLRESKWYLWIHKLDHLLSSSTAVRFIFPWDGSLFPMDSTQTAWGRGTNC